MLYKCTETRYYYTHHYFILPIFISDHNHNHKIGIYCPIYSKKTGRWDITGVHIHKQLTTLKHELKRYKKFNFDAVLWQYSTRTWSTMLSLPGSEWVFEQLNYNHFQFPPTLHVGDYDMDGFPDVVTVLSSPVLVIATLYSPFWYYLIMYAIACTTHWRRNNILFT